MHPRHFCVSNIARAWAFTWMFAFLISSPAAVSEQDTKKPVYADLSGFRSIDIGTLKVRTSKEPVLLAHFFATDYQTEEEGLGERIEITVQKNKQGYLVVTIERSGWLDDSVVGNQVRLIAEKDAFTHWEVKAAGTRHLCARGKAKFSAKPCP